jgi:hypothetical protein
VVRESTVTVISKRRSMAGVNMGDFLLRMPVLGMEAYDPRSRPTAVRRRTW